MKKEELLEIVPDLNDEDAEKLLGLFTRKISEKSTEYENAMTELKENSAKEEKERLIVAELEKANLKSIEVVKALLDYDTISLEDGNLIGLKEQLEELKKEYAFLFCEKMEKPKFTKQTRLKDEPFSLEKLSYKERLKLYSEMPEVYKRLAK